MSLIRDARPSLGKVFEHFANACKRNGQIAWGSGSAGEFELMHGLGEAKANADSARNSSTYVDVRNWRFTPASFRLILSDLRALGLTQLNIAKEFNTEGCEFYVTLNKVSGVTETDRRFLLEAAMKQAV